MRFFSFRRGPNITTAHKTCVLCTVNKKKSASKLIKDNEMIFLTKEIKFYFWRKSTKRCQASYNALARSRQNIHNSSKNKCRSEGSIKNYINYYYNKI